MAALVLLAALAPWLLALGFLILVLDRQNPLFSQSRVGLHRHPFVIYKLRTMKSKQISPAGRVLRKTGQDELPQLWNIARGQMAFVGPRPLLESDIQRLGWTGPAAAARWSVLPGITGPAQLLPLCNARASLEADLAFAASATWAKRLGHLALSLAIPFRGKKARPTVFERHPQ